MKRTVYILMGLVFCTSLSFAAGAADRPLRESGKEAGLMLDLQKVSLGTLANVEQRRQYMSTVQLEKQRIQNFTLNMVYDNAYSIYKQGDYQRAAELSDVILSIDPSMTKAQTLSNTATKMATYGTISESEILDMKYNEAIMLYKQGRLIESQSKFEEILVLNPNEEDAKAWIKRIDADLVKIHTRRGYYAYKQGDYQEALNQWYNVLMIKKDDPTLTAKIAEVENLIKKDEHQKALDQAFEYYSQGRLVDAYKEFNRAQEIQPSEQQTQKFIVQLKEEIANNYYNAGNKAYNERKYNTAIANWKEAQKWGYNKRDILLLVKNAEKAKNKPATVTKTEDKTDKTTDNTPKGTVSNTSNGELPNVLPVASKTPEKDTPTDNTVKTPDNKGTEPSGNKTIPGKDKSPDKIPAVTTEVEGDEFPTQTIVEKSPTRVSEAARQASIKRYRYGLAAFSEGNFEKAKEEWQAALNLNPENSDAALGLKRVEEKYSNR
ncbi:MAG: tetratricopeptide repeat protein [Elusimicrobiaceae bacterium]|nr:tetratricopeptide repeat protein [Elusimicrobiaceae bacterium]